MKPATVLLCDDALFMRTLLRGILTAGGYEIAAEAPTGRAAVELFAEHRPDVVLMDMVMPEMSGLDAVRAIRDIDKTARIVMCSAMGQQELIDQAIEAGACGFISKPFSTVRVLEVLADAVAVGR
jgi:two-component system chemotaxis response regulator CheY